MQPLLSIGVPTYNRAHLLSHVLRGLSREYAGLSEQDQVEFVVSDNCSEDGTAEVVNEFQKALPIRYHRNERNIGPAANVVQVPTLASGKYCWIFGDDDLIVPGALSRVLKLLQAYPDVPAIVVGFSYQKEENREGYIGEEVPQIFERPVFGSNHPPKLVSRWEQTILETQSPAAHTSVVGCVFNTYLWRQHAPSTDVVEQAEPFSSLESTFPHTVTWASFLIGREVIFAPKPHVYFFVGAQEWFKPKWVTILFTLCLELSQYMLAKNASENAITYFEDLILKSASLQQLLCEPNDFSRRFFSMKKLIARYGHRDVLWENLSERARRAPGGGQLRFLTQIAAACWSLPSCWARCTRVLIVLLGRILGQAVQRYRHNLKV